MHHLHFKSLPSTQIHLKENLAALLMIDRDILITTEEQTSGIGRQGSPWDFHKGSLAFSFTLTPNPIVTLTTIEVGLILCQLMDLKIKWPNDLLNKDGKKVGGIIASLVKDKLIVGVGVNSDLEPIRGNYPYDASGIKIKTSPLKIYSHLLSSRIAQADILKMWSKYSLYDGKKVVIVDGTHRSHGIFSGIGPDGEALLLQNNQICRVFTGSLFLVD